MILKYIGGLIVGSLIAGAIFWHVSEVNKARAEVQAAWDAEKLQAIDAARIEDARRIAALDEVKSDAQSQIAIAAADAAAARDASQRLRERFKATAARACPAAPVAEGSPPAAEAGLVLADVFGVLQDHAGQVAEYADRARIAGEACERAYQSLTAE